MNNYARARGQSIKGASHTSREHASVQSSTPGGQHSRFYNMRHETEMLRPKSAPHPHRPPGTNLPDPPIIYLAEVPAIDFDWLICSRIADRYFTPSERKIIIYVKTRVPHKTCRLLKVQLISALLTLGHTPPSEPGQIVISVPHTQPLCTLVGNSGEEAEGIAPSLSARI